jgi:hypothetical protein
MTSVALIPPFCFLRDTGHRALHMFLPECLEDEVQQKEYDSIPRLPGTHILLDNGMFEEGGKPINTETLLHLAGKLRVNEVVLPDVRDSRALTCEAVVHFLKTYREETSYRLMFMAVVQGENFADRCATIRSLADIVPPGTVLGFPRLLTRESPKARLELMEWTVSTYGARFRLHMLGMSREWPGELKRAAQQFGPRLRGIDTSAPFIYAYHGRTVRPQWEDKTERPADYFNLPADAFPRDLVRYNTHVLDSWIHGSEPSPLQMWVDR